MLNERKLTKPELAKREDIVMDMKKNKRKLVKRYGKDAEKVMYGRATNMAKKQTENMDNKKPNLRKMIEDALKNPKGATVEKNLSEYMGNEGDEVMISKAGKKDNPLYVLEKPDGSAQIDMTFSSEEEAKKYATKKGLKLSSKKGMNMNEGINPEVHRLVNGFVKKMADRYDYSLQDAVYAITGVLRSQNYDGLSESLVTEDKSEAAYELQEIMDQLYELSDQAKMIFRNNFPTEYRRLDAYGALDFGTSSNRYDVTLEGTLENLDMEDDDEDMMQEGIPTVFDDKSMDDLLNIILKYVEDPADAEKELERFDAGGFEAMSDSVQANLDRDEEYKAWYNELHSIEEDLDLGHQDDEPGMLKGDLYKIGKYSMELYQMMDSLEGMGEVDLPHWWQSKIVTAKNMISGAKHYLDFELKEPQIDAMVNVAAEEDVIDEGMSEEEWAKAKEEDRLAKLPMDQQAKIKKAIAMLKAEKKSKK
jgi:hypothetical protein